MHSRQAESRGGGRFSFCAYAARRAFCALISGLALSIALPGTQAGAQDLKYARDFRMAGDASRIRVVVDFDREPQMRWFLLDKPCRLVFDLSGTNLAFAPDDLKARGLISGVRYGAGSNGDARLVLAAKGPFAVERVDVLKNETAPGYRLVADLVAGSARKFREAMADQNQTTGSTRSDLSAASPSEEQKRFRIVLDAGHGGQDGGAKGIDGTVEKDVTLAFARELRDRMTAAGRYEVFMTRDADIFIPLDERVAIARRDEASLLISIHADTIDVPELHGATVYTVSDKASDPASEATAVRENLSDQVAGIAQPSDSQQVTDILVDLIRRETHGFSARFARALVDEFSSSIGMIKNPHRSAGFRVLRAPDVPSVLIELGYLSNVSDEAKLKDPQWRRKAIDGIAEAVSRFSGASRAAAAP